MIPTPSRPTAPRSAATPTADGGRRFVSAIAAVLAILGLLFASVALAPTAKALPMDPAQDETHITYDPGCIHVPGNIAGSVWHVYCPSTNKIDKVVVRFSNGDPAHSGSMRDDQGGNAYKEFWVFDPRATDEWKNLVLGWEAWYGDNGKPNKTDGCHYRFYNYEPDCSKQQQNKPKDLDLPPLADRGYGPESLWTPASNIDRTQPCTFLKHQAKTFKNVDLNCKTPTKGENPCPADAMPPDMLKICQADNVGVLKKYFPGEVSAPSTACQVRQGKVCDYGSGDVATVSNDGRKSFTDDPIGWTKQEVSAAVADVIIWWIFTPDPLIEDDPQTGIYNRQNLEFLARHTNVITLFIVVLSILIASIRMSLSRDARHANEVVKGIAVLILFMGLSVLVVNLWVRAINGYYRWLLVRGLDPNSDAAVSNGNAQKAAEDAVKAFTGGLEDMNFVLFLGISLAMLAGGVMTWAQMNVAPIAVSGGLAVLAMPLAASNTKAGKESAAKVGAVVFAFASAKGAYVTVFVFVARVWAPRDAGAMSAEMQARGALMLLLSSLMLPAMVRMLFPLVAPATGGEKGAMALFGGALAGGARMIRR